MIGGGSGAGYSGINENQFFPEVIRPDVICAHVLGGAGKLVTSLDARGMVYYPSTLSAALLYGRFFRVQTGCGR